MNTSTKFYKIWPEQNGILAPYDDSIISYLKNLNLSKVKFLLDSGIYNSIYIPYEAYLNMNVEFLKNIDDLGFPVCIEIKGSRKIKRENSFKNIFFNFLFIDPVSDFSFLNLKNDEDVVTVVLNKNNFGSFNEIVDKYSGNVFYIFEFLNYSYQMDLWSWEDVLQHHKEKKYTSIKYSFPGLFQYCEDRSDYSTPYFLNPKKSSISSNEPQVSVIIPTYNHSEEVVTSIKYLSRNKAKFELIIVDDGSNDLHRKKVEEFLLSSSLNFKYFYYPRFKERTMGDNFYRVGKCRNLGVLHASSNQILFLDSGILIKDDYLQKISDFHNNYDVIQPKRWHLQSSCLDFINLNKDKDLISRSQWHWEKFQNKVQIWADYPIWWKYFSTFCLSIKKDLFLKVGGFREDYVYYGFEDTDLGLRLRDETVNFLLADEDVFHIYQPKERTETEISNDPLKKSQGIFKNYWFSEDISRLI